MSTFTYDLRVQGCTRTRLAAYARSLSERPVLSIQPIDAPADASHGAYRVVVRPDGQGLDAATTIARLAWLLKATGRLVSVQPRS
ncbi:hypothetical protein [Leifsonia shinshuensis]|uniref:hypothetical protein n=1 Tax=Leifsonia TaxID=110932 RepID=UPI002854468C|nr:hypothetical protein [Leifsonia shinshuensis]MDR6969898.1 hypothetical protein [Leifsonia shinshuensis]